jgi:tetratricopeptide (TPR) repeat protein
VARAGAGAGARCLLHGELGTTLLDRVSEDGPADELDAGIFHLAAASGSAPAGHAGRGFWFGLLGRALQERFARAGRLEDLDASITAYKAAEKEIPPGDADACELLDSLATAVMDRWESRRDRGDLDAAIDALSRAVELYPSGVPGLALRHGVLGDLLRERFGFGGDPADLDVAIQQYRAALATADATERPGLLGALGYTLGDRYQVSRDLADVEAIISCLSEAVTATPLEDPERVPLLMALSGAFGERFAKGHELADLEAAIEGLSEALKLLPEDDPDQVRLSGLLGGLLRDRFVANGGRDPADLDRAVARLTAALNATPSSHPDRAEWLLALGACLVDGRLFDRETGAGDGDLDTAVRHLRGALSTMGEGHPFYSDLHAMLGSVLGLRVHEQADGADLDEAIAHLQRSARLDGPARDPAFKSARLSDLALLLRLRFERRGAIEDLDAAVGYHEAAVRAMVPGHPLEATANAALGTALMMRYRHLGRSADLNRSVSTLSAAFAAVQPTDPHWRAVANSLALALGARFEQRHDLADLAAAARCVRSALAATPATHRDRPALLSTLGSVLLRHTREHPEPGLLDAAVEHLDEAARATADGSAGRVLCEMALGAALLLRYQRLGHRADLDTAVARLSSAQAALAGQPGNPYWPRLRGLLASAYRMRGEHARGRSIGLEGLRGWSWEVLLQSGSAHAVSVARFAAGQAAEVAASCLADNAIEDAVQALELGRGLTLHAATVSASVPRRLRDAGRADLAGEWERTLIRARAAVAAGAPAPIEMGAGGMELPIPSDLRHRTLQALTVRKAAGPREQLLEAPSIGEIHGALAAIGADALVYLTPGTATTPGSALIVRSGQAPSQLPLHQLRIEPGGELDAYAYALGALGGPADDGTKTGRDRWRAALARLHPWSWRVAMGPLLAETATWELGRPPWLVLAPAGQLGLVPWHAASTSAAGRTRHALEEATLSSTPSARLLCDVARRGTAVRNGRAFVLGNPTGDLPYAAREAHQVLDAFYPDGVYMGRDPSGTAVADGAPAEILAHMPSAEAPGMPVLHFACHAVAVSEPPAGSHLRVGGSQRLTVERLLDHARGRDPDRPGPLVVLSACTTDLPGQDYDEALTLATGFLVAGAASAVGSLWQVPDWRTAMLMFMFHHYVRQACMKPGTALRAAQLWMLDTDREPPEGMPPELACRSGEAGLADPGAWAAFVHRGW